MGETASALGAEYIRQLESEVRATRACLEVVPLDRPDWKPHKRSMGLGYLAILIADIPRWIHLSIKDSVIDFATYEHYSPTSTYDLVKHFDQNVIDARRSLNSVTDDGLKETFELKREGKLLMSVHKDVNVFSSINHMVHHRGQLTVYMRLLDIPVPSIYGPSADVPMF